MQMKGRICMVTGATSGIGEVTAEALAKLGAKVIAVGRNPEKSISTVDRIKAKTGNSDVEYMLADFSILGEVRKLAETFTSKYNHLHVLVNNAGAVFEKRIETDGVEMTFAVNHLAPYLLTNLLLDTIKNSAPARIINVSSLLHSRAEMNFEDLQASKAYDLMNAYGQSKLANILFTYELAKRLEGSGVTVNALHPGIVATNLGSNNEGFKSKIWRVINKFGISPEEGAKTSIYLATSPEVANVTGKYFEKCKAVPSSKESYDKNASEKLWCISAELTGIK